MFWGGVGASAQGPELSSEPGRGLRVLPDVRDQVLFGPEVTHKPLERGEGIADAALLLGDQSEGDERVEQLLDSLAQTLKTCCPVLRATRQERFHQFLDWTELALRCLQGSSHYVEFFVDVLERHAAASSRSTFTREEYPTAPPPRRPPHS